MDLARLLGKRLEVGSVKDFSVNRDLRNEDGGGGDVVVSTV